MHAIQTTGLRAPHFRSLIRSCSIPVPHRPKPLATVTGVNMQVCDTTDSWLLNCSHNAGDDLPTSEDASALGCTLVAMLNRFARHCSKTEDAFEKMRHQNLAQSAEIQDLRDRVRKLEALVPPTPRLATPPYHDRGLRAPPSTPRMRPPHHNDAHTETATIESGRVVRMMVGERPRELWTACRPRPMANGRSELERAGLESPYIHPRSPPTPRARRPASPKPPSTRHARFSPIDAPPMPTRSVNSQGFIALQHAKEQRP